MSAAAARTLWTGACCSTFTVGGGADDPVAGADQGGATADARRRRCLFRSGRSVPCRRLRGLSPDNDRGAREPGGRGQHDRDAWPAQHARLEAVFAGAPRDHWCRLLEGTDACFAPVLSMDEAAAHPHNVVRATFAGSAGRVQPSSATCFRRTPKALHGQTMPPTAAVADILQDW